MGIAIFVMENSSSIREIFNILHPFTINKNMGASCIYLRRSSLNLHHFGLFALSLRPTASLAFLIWSTSYQSVQYHLHTSNYQRVSPNKHISLETVRLSHNRFLVDFEKMREQYADLSHTLPHVKPLCQIIDHTRIL